MDALLLTYGERFAPAGAVAHVRTGGNDRAAWARSRHAAAVAEFERRGLDRSTAWWVSAALVSQWARETGWGRNEWSCSEGNIRATSAWHGDTMLLQGSDDSAPAPYRAYPVEPNCETGVADAIHLAVDGSHYRSAYERLVASAANGPYVVGNATRYAVPLDLTTWYSDVMYAGWNPWTQAGLDEYRSIAGTVAGIVGAPTHVSTTWRNVVAVGAGAGVVAVLYAAWRGR